MTKPNDRFNGHQFFRKDTTFTDVWFMFHNKLKKIFKKFDTASYYFYIKKKDLTY